MNGERVGSWRVERGQHHLTYDPAWVASPRGRALSVSLPLTATWALRGPVVAHYFDNLLPDNPRIRERIAARYRTGSTRAFDLLQAIGRDCVGAVQLLPEDLVPEGWDRIDSAPLREAEIAALLRGAAGDGALGAPPLKGCASRWPARRRKRAAAPPRPLAAPARGHAHHAHPEAAAGSGWR